MLCYSFLLPFALQWLQGDAMIYQKNPFLPPQLLVRPPGGLRRTAYHQYTGKPMTDEGFTGIRSTPQLLDHFNESDTRTWYQVYWPNSQYAKLHDGRDLVFLLVGGDSYESLSSVTDPNWQIVKWAEQFGAHVYRLEHRFFGKAPPLGQTGVEGLKYLSVNQAVEDVAFFAKSSMAAIQLKNPSWILFGDGYGGILASLARTRHPDIFAGAVVSSASIHYTREWPQFASFTEMILRNIKLPDNSYCDSWTRNFLNTTAKFMDTPDLRRYLNERLHVSPALPHENTITEQDRWHFFASILSVFQGFFPLTYHSSPTMYQDQFTAENLCQKMFGGANFEALFSTYQWFMNDHYMAKKPEVFTSWYEQMVKDLKRTLTDRVDEDTTQNVHWLWLSCTDLGMFPVSDANSVWQTSVPIKYYDNLCIDVFATTLKNVKTPSNAAVGDASNIVYVYGSFDPSLSLGQKTSDPANNIVVVNIEGVGALTDLFSEIKSEPLSVSAGRMKIGNFISGTIPWKNTDSSTKIVPSPSSPATVPLPSPPSIQQTAVTNPSSKPTAATSKPGEQTTKSAVGTGFLQISFTIFTLLFTGLSE